MIAGQTTPIYLSRYALDIHPANSSGLGHLFAAAIVNRQFCKTLLEQPETALKNGYLGEAFELSTEDRERVTSAGAQSLVDLAKTVTNDGQGVVARVNARHP